MTVNVLITGVGGGGVGEKVFQALRLSKSSYRLICTDTNPYAWCLYEANKAYIVPHAWEKEYYKRILEICKKEAVKVLIPGSDPELNFFAQNYDKFKKTGIILLMNDPKLISLCQNKWKMYQFLTKNGFLMPRSWITFENINCHFPVIIKPYIGGGGSTNIYVAQNKEELKFFCRYLNKQKIKFMIQEYVESPEEEYTVGVLHSLNGNLLESICLKRIVKGRLHTLLKIKDYKNHKNILTISSGVSHGIVDDFKNIRDYSEKVAKALGSKGPLNIQCRVNDAGIWIFEINPRFSGTESIRALLGYNAPDILIRLHVLGENIEKIKFKHGIVLRGLEDHYMSFEDFEKMKNQ